MLTKTPSQTAAKRCPYSSHTVMACRHYVPRSAHGDAADAALCKFSAVEHVGEHQVRLICHRL